MKFVNFKTIMTKTMNGIKFIFSQTVNGTKKVATKISDKIDEKNKTLDVTIKFITSIADLNFSDSNSEELKHNAPLVLLSNMAKDILIKLDKKYKNNSNIKTTKSKFNGLVIEHDKEN